MAACRVGYKVGYDLEGLTLGLGGRYLGFQLDYSFSLMEELDVGKVKMTRMMDKLEAKQIVERKRRGMNNIIVLRR